MVKFNKSGDYYKDLAMRESSGNHKIKNKIGYLGLYQMGEGALIDTGYYIKGVDKRLNNDWSGKWTGKHNINSEQDFLNNPIVQEIAIREYHNIIWNRYLKDYHQYDGRIINTIKLTKSGMISASHLVGHGGVKEFIKSNGLKIRKDGNGCLCTEYLRLFAEYNIDFSTDKLKIQLTEYQNTLCNNQDVSKNTKSNFSKAFFNIAKEVCLNVAGSLCGVFTKKLFSNEITQKVVNDSVKNIITSFQTSQTTTTVELTDQQYNAIGANKAIREIEGLIKKISSLNTNDLQEDLDTLNKIKNDVANKKFLPQDYAFLIFKIANKIDDFKKVIS